MLPYKFFQQSLLEKQLVSSYVLYNTFAKIKYRNNFV